MSLRTIDTNGISPRGQARTHSNLENLPLMLAVISAFLFVGACIAVLG